jgi:hypothetical protein
MRCSCDLPHWHYIENPCRRCDPLRILSDREIREYTPLSEDEITEALEQGKKDRDALEKAMCVSIDPKIRFRNK